MKIPARNRLRQPTEGAESSQSISPFSLIVEPCCQNGPERSRPRCFCATKWSLEGEDRSARLQMRERGRDGQLVPLSAKRTSLAPVLQPVAFAKNVDCRAVMQQSRIIVAITRDRVGRGWRPVSSSAINRSQRQFNSSATGHAARSTDVGSSFGPAQSSFKRGGTGVVDARGIVPLGQ